MSDYSLRARPNINGNTPEDFMQAYVALASALRAIDAARSVVSGVLHSRNYQHTTQEACTEDRRRVLDDMHKAYALIGSINSGISDIVLEQEMTS